MFGFIEDISVWNGRTTDYNGIWRFDIWFSKEHYSKGYELRENNNVLWSNKCRKYFWLCVPIGALHCLSAC